MKPKLIILNLITLIFLISCSSRAHENFVYNNGLYLIQETTYGQFYSPNKDSETQKVVEVLALAYKSNYDRLTNMFEYSPSEKTIFHVYTNREQFYEIIGRKTEGTYDSKDNVIKVFTPPLLSDPTIQSEYTDQIVHEFIHAIIQQINPIVGNIKWLDEGIAYYASLQLETELYGKTQLSDIPTLEQLKSPNYFDEFGNSAYFYSGLIIKFIVEKYGIDSLNDIIRDPLKLETILNTSIDNLYINWKANLE